MGANGSTEMVIPEGARSKKLYVHYEDTDNELDHCTLKFTLPIKWVGASIDQLQDYFIETYHEKKPNAPKLKTEMYHMENKNNKILRGDETLHDTTNDRDDIYLRKGPRTYKYSKDPKDENKEEINQIKEKKLRCKNYGCAKEYYESQNKDNICFYHIKPPTFHDTKKGWQCCSSKMVYDWEDFEKIPTCTIGRHSINVPIVNDTLGTDRSVSENSLQSQNIITDISSTKSVTPAVRSIDEYNKQNTNAVTAISSTIRSMTEVKKTENRTDGKARCRNYGCQREYFIEINNDKACSHHSKPPIFHDSGKYWGCCPKIVKYDFDEFLKIPGCIVSCHNDGSTP